MSNLAAALLKLELWVHYLIRTDDCDTDDRICDSWDLAENAATRALIHDPKHIKARFRRAIARKELHTFDTAEADLQRILSIDPTNASARSELEEIRRLRQTTLGSSAPELDEIWDGMEFELEDESDSEDFFHCGRIAPAAWKGVLVILVLVFRLFIVRQCGRPCDDEHSGECRPATV
ncbi:hypothetical protein NUW54_g8026 [Trametes sanguinea]|uniref:Uncharacterized protein n=1 Tax=Trametes sanguinea TaxID=158606 RepID=A0ACC1PG95_9APHY|nr:hypothetical protein NUW54_g8026 [Trametes sanguinea]